MEQRQQGGPYHEDQNQGEGWRRRVRTREGAIEEGTERRSVAFSQQMGSRPCWLTDPAEMTPILPLRPMMPLPCMSILATSWSHVILPASSRIRGCRRNNRGDLHASLHALGCRSGIGRRERRAHRRFGQG